MKLTVCRFGPVRITCGGITPLRSNLSLESQTTVVSEEISIQALSVERLAILESFYEEESL